MSNRGAITGNHRAPLSERGNDLYETPPEAVTALLKVEDIPDYFIWEPAVGRGAISKVLMEAGKTVFGSDLVDYGTEYQDAVWDFLKQDSVPRNCRAIVTNPPYKIASLFAAHALTLVPKVYLLLRLAYLEGGAGRNASSVARRETLDGGKLARVHVFKNRLPMMHREGWLGKKASSSMAFAWFVFDQDHNGPTIIDRISWERNNG